MAFLKGGITKLGLAQALDILNGGITYTYGSFALYQNYSITKKLVLSGKFEWWEFFNTKRQDSNLNIPPESDRRLFSGGSNTNRGFREGILDL